MAVSNLLLNMEVYVNIMNEKHKSNLITYLSYLPLAGSIVANIISLIFYFYMEKPFSIENVIRPIIYFAVFYLIGIGFGKYFSKDYQISSKKVIVFFIITFILIHLGKYFNFF